LVCVSYKMPNTKVLRLVLGDQLSASLASLVDCNKDEDVILLCEVWDEATYVKHHKKKIAFLFSAMRHFALDLQQQGYRVDYVRLDDPLNTGSFGGEVRRAITRHQPDRVVVTAAGEYRVLHQMKGWADAFGVAVDIRPDSRFLCSIEQFADWAQDRKQARMEFFYREMRRTYTILMAKDGPEGGEWNYDNENRKPPSNNMVIPKPLLFSPDQMTCEVIDLVAQRFADHFGDLEPFHFAVTRTQALQVLAHFIQERLPNFGTYQDAMIEGQPWMYHSHISFYLNCGLLQPLEVVKAAEQAYRQGSAPLNATEGFIRQIIGWREYVRGIYWLKAPDYANENFLAATRPLPQFYWTAETKMNCLKQCITETRQNAYAHHIQRLMVLGNFALLAGINPREVNEWFLVVYADAYEWVELPNVSGMILFADGGYLASKPYAAGGAYINKMSNYCKNCFYNVKEKTGPQACPFNYLYWDFMLRNADKLRGNARLGMTYRTLETMASDKIADIQHSATVFFEGLE
jgi:deoxyribodipyrimidine photolyase-related protein